MRFVIAAVMILSSSNLYAQESQEQKTYNIISNISMYTNVGLELYDAAKSDNRKRELTITGIRLASVASTVFIIKKLTNKKRPCYPDCGIEDNDSSFPSGHTAIAFTATRDKLAFTIPLGVLTGIGRIRANKHDIIDVLAGSLIGSASAQLIK